MEVFLVVPERVMYIGANGRFSSFLIMSIAINWPIGPFTLPPELLALEVTDAYLFSRYDDGSTERRIFCNVPLLKKELDQLEELTEYLCSLCVTLKRRMEPKRLRYLQTAAGNVKKAASMMMETERWRRSFFDKPIDDREIYKQLNLGFVYISGRDKLLRPCLVVRVTQMLRNGVDQNTSLRCVCFLMEFIIRYMLLPGKCESTVTLLDLENIGLMQFVPAVSRTRAIFGVLAEHYVGRSALTFVKSAPAALEGLIRGLVPEEKRRKIVYVQATEDIAKHFDAEQLEVQYGGRKPTITSFYPVNHLSSSYALAGTENYKLFASCHRCLGLPTIRGELWERGVPHVPLRYAAEAVQYFNALGLPPPENTMFPCEGQALESKALPGGSGGVHEMLFGIANLPSPVPEGTMQDMMADDYDLVMTHANEDSEGAGEQLFAKERRQRTASTGSEATPMTDSSVVDSIEQQRPAEKSRKDARRRSKLGPRMTPERPVSGACDRLSLSRLRGTPTSTAS
ncbi:hypothetical protein FOZ60_005536 [Perkinsus olseni]|uniref:CRAL-TRIO domain-containing protein n=2 Tax=Perkinsus olseni TaxID=32597 RepID=A0A7J6PGW0_PEROL|nr:hypothetical protein FOZ60_005536 [Perkinsus olseni]